MARTKSSNGKKNGKSSNRKIKKDGFQQGNQLWQTRSSHGRNPIFKTPQDLLNGAMEYFKWCVDNPWYKNEAVKSGVDVGKIIQVPTARPFTVAGLSIFLDIEESTLWNYSKRDCDFLKVVKKIKTIIYAQKFEGAAVGTFNSNIIARDLGLRDIKHIDANIHGKIDHEHNHKHTIDFANIDNTDIKMLMQLTSRDNLMIEHDPDDNHKQ